MTTANATVATQADKRKIASGDLRTRWPKELISMRVRLPRFLRRLSLIQQFMLANLLVLVTSMAVMGWWVGNQIEAGVVSRVAGTTALYIDSLIGEHLQNLDRDASGNPILPPDLVAELDRDLQGPPVGQEVVSASVWTIADGKARILYSAPINLAGQEYPLREDLERAWQGEVVAGLSSLDHVENATGHPAARHLLEIYSPVRQNDTNRVVAVAEIYHQGSRLDDEIGTARQRTWLAVGVATLAIYLFLLGIVRQGSNTIARQQTELSDQVARLTSLMAQNGELEERVRRAAARTTSLNERFLRRISSELHDGPAQDLGLALLRLDSLARQSSQCPVPYYPVAGESTGPYGDDYAVIQSSMSRALQEIRSIATGLPLPQIEDLTLAEIVQRVVHNHERRTKTTVELRLDALPESVPLPVKITIYRLAQEALSNAFRHGGGIGQRVQVAVDRVKDRVRVEISDRGAGFDPTQRVDREQHLGLAGMRERVESLGGFFEVTSGPGRGTRITAYIPLRRGEDDQ